MRSRSSLAMMEQIVMLAVFALAAALCLQAFVRSDKMSRQSEARDRAAVLCQSAAEALLAANGDFQRAAGLLDAVTFTEDSLSVFYGEDWQPSASLSPQVYPFGYTLGASRGETDVPGLGRAEVWVQEDETGEELFRLEVCWQEVAADA